MSTPVRYCEIEGCARRRFGRAMCALHYDRWRDGRDLHNPERWVNRPNGLRRCSTCRVEKTPGEFHRNKTRFDGLASECKPCVLEKRRARRAAHPRTTLKTPTACGMCGATFQADRRRSLYCSQSCSAEAKRLDDLTRPVDREKKAESSRRWTAKNPAKNWAKSARYNARKRAGFVEDVDRIVLFERDGWTCQLCGEPIDPSLRRPNGMSASVDHIVPVSRGGQHSYENCQAAHLLCNMKKGATVEAGAA